MIPLVISTDEDCYCGRKDWRRGEGQGGCTLIWCDFCGYVLDIIERDGRHA